MQRPLWRSLKPGFGRRLHARVAGCLLVALAGITWGAGRAAAHGPGQSPGTLHPLGSAPSPIAPAELYARRIRPLLAKNCYGCHGEAQTSGLDRSQHAIGRETEKCLPGLSGHPCDRISSLRDACVRVRAPAASESPGW